MNLTRLGVIVNPRAGDGQGGRAARAAVSALAPAHVLVGAGEMGADVLAGEAPIQVLEWSPRTGVERTRWLATQMAAQGVDGLLVVGGDGTLADVAWALRESASAPALIGLGAGTANVGPLLTCRAAEAAALRADSLVCEDVPGLIAGVNGRDLGLGFNDVVVDATVLATVDGAMVNVDVADKLRGLNTPRAPIPVHTSQTEIWRMRNGTKQVVASADQVHTVIVGLPDPRFYGKAIAGGALLSSMLDEPAGCLVCDHLLITVHIDAAAHAASEPVVSRYAGLAEGDTLHGRGFRVGVALCADGNPLQCLQPADVIHVRAQRRLARACRLRRADR